jgi:hypothetical protein
LPNLVELFRKMYLKGAKHKRVVSVSCRLSVNETSNEVGKPDSAFSTQSFN